LTVRILYKASVRRDLRKIDQANVKRLLREIKETLSEMPARGQLLHGEFQGLRKLPVGDYRVIYTIPDGDVLVLRVRHRSKAYD